MVAEDFAAAALTGDLPQPVTLPAAPSSASVARHLLRDAVGPLLPDDVLADVELMVTELVANVVLHARSVCELHVASPDPGVLRVSVADIASDAPVRRPVTATTAGGRGLLLIEAMARAWGTEPNPAGGKTVWFEVAV